MSEYYAVIRSTNHLAHYGVKGMKWGVRKAVLLGNEKKLRKNFNKAAKKLNKLQDKALRSGKYAAKAATYGTAAAATGALAIAGTEGLKKATSKLKDSVYSKWAETGKIKDKKLQAYLAKKYYKTKAVSDVADKLDKWGQQQSALAKYNPYSDKVKFTKNTVMRVGAGAAAAGLGAVAARNAYIASHGRKYLDKADSWRNAMDETFAGTKYQGQYVQDPKRKKRRKNYG